MAKLPLFALLFILLFACSNDEKSNQNNYCLDDLFKFCYSAKDNNECISEDRLSETCPYGYNNGYKTTNESCFEYIEEYSCTTREVTYLQCYETKENKCEGKSRFWQDGELAGVAQINEDCLFHGWMYKENCDSGPNNTINRYWEWECRLNGRTVEDAACNNFDKW